MTIQFKMRSIRQACLQPTSYHDSMPHSPPKSNGSTPQIWEFSGLKVNVDKSEAMFLTLWKYNIKSFLGVVSRSGPKTSHMWEITSPHQADLHKGVTPSLAWIRQRNMFKIIYITKVITSIYSGNSKFIWNTKRPRLQWEPPRWADIESANIVSYTTDFLMWITCLLPETTLKKSPYTQHTMILWRIVSFQCKLQTNPSHMLSIIGLNASDFA